MITAAPGEARSPALALVNTRRLTPNGEDDDLAAPAGARKWLREHGLPAPALDAVGLARLARLRAAIREVFTALSEDRMPAADAVAAVNDAARADPAAPQLDWPRKHWRSARPGEAEEVLAALARDAIDVVTGDLGRMVRACEAHGCVRLFLREHARRRWCSTTCGDRVRAARHQRLVVQQRNAR